MRCSHLVLKISPVPRDLIPCKPTPAHHILMSRTPRKQRLHTVTKCTQPCGTGEYFVLGKNLKNTTRVRRNTYPRTLLHCCSLRHAEFRSPAYLPANPHIIIPCQRGRKKWEIKFRAFSALERRSLDVPSLSMIKGPPCVRTKHAGLTSMTRPRRTKKIRMHIGQTSLIQTFGPSPMTANK